MKPLSGVLSVIQTPFRADDTLDEHTLRREVDWLYECGVSGLVVGMVSEVQRLTEAERDTLHATLVKLSAGRGPVVGSVGSESLVQAQRHARAAEAAGVDAVMAIPPTLTRCGPEQLHEYYAGLIRSVRVPVVVQDASGYVGNPIPVSLCGRLHAEFGDRVMFKPEAHPIGPNLTALHQATGGRAKVFEGSGGLALIDTYRRGIAGTMPGGDVPWAMVKLWQALEVGDEAAAAAIHSPICALVGLMTSLDAFVSIQKHLLREQGIFPTARVRGPLGFEPDAGIVAEARRLLRLLQSVCRSQGPCAGIRPPADIKP